MVKKKPLKPLTEAQSRMVEENVDLAYFYAERIHKYRIERPDRRQAAVLGLARAASEYTADMGIEFGTYAGGVIRNEIASALCNERLVHTESPLKSCGFDEREPFTLDGPQDDAARTERIAAVRDAVSRLPKRHRMLISSRFLDGDTPAESGKRLGLNKRTLLHVRDQAFKKMRPMLKSVYGEAS